MSMVHQTGIMCRYLNPGDLNFGFS